MGASPEWAAESATREGTPQGVPSLFSVPDLT